MEGFPSEAKIFIRILSVRTICSNKTLRLGFRINTPLIQVVPQSVRLIGNAVFQDSVLPRNNQHVVKIRFLSECHVQRSQ